LRSSGAPMTELADAMARRAVERTVADRREEYAREMGRIVEATYELIERTGDVEPSLRDILRETGLSTQAFYRFFQSKDELLLLLLDDGRRQLVGYLEHRMSRATTPAGRVRAWIEGVLAQATVDRAASRTRPFLANQDRLTEVFPAEQQASVDLLIGLLEDPIAAAAPRRRRSDVRRDAEAVYHLVFGVLHAHLSRRTKPTAAEVEHLVRFSLKGIG
jgi:AcrR family transcriptional regulator